MKKKTFKIGGVHPCDNKIAAGEPIEIFPLVDTVYISMNQHLGAPAEPIVQVGDKVKVGQLIATPTGFISGNIHSSVSGTVKSIAPRKDATGGMPLTVEIAVEGDEWCKEIDRSDRIISDLVDTPEEIVSKVKNAGIVGLGGAAFPTHVKLAPPKDKVAEALIINGAECEPYITANDRMMRERPIEVVVGAAIMMKALGVKNGFIAIEDNKPEAIKAIGKAVDNIPDIKVVVLKKRYPQGGEKQLIDAVIGRQVPSGKLPIDVGAVVQNVATAIAVYEAVEKNKPLIDNVVTVTGQCLPRSFNFKVRVGTPLTAIIEAAGGFPENCAKLILGGPMMGRAVSNLDAATSKATSSLLFLTETQTKRKEESNCIRCGKCADACPMGLEPWLLNKLARAGGRLGELEQERIYDCIDCGCCLYTCPANIPLLDLIRINKAEVMKVIRARAAAKKQ